SATKNREEFRGAILHRELAPLRHRTGRVSKETAGRRGGRRSFGGLPRARNVLRNARPSGRHFPSTQLCPRRDVARHGSQGRLARDPKAEWSPEAISYWKHFGEILGSPMKALPVPATLSGVVARAVALRPQFASRMKAYDANIVAQTLDYAPGQGFELMIATN